MIRIALVFPIITAPTLLLDFYQELAERENVAVDVYLNQDGKLIKNQSPIFAKQESESLGEDYDLCFDFTRQYDIQNTGSINAKLYVRSNYQVKNRASISSLIPVILRSGSTPFEIIVMHKDNSVPSLYVEGCTQTQGRWKDNDRDLLRVVLFVFKELAEKFAMGIPIVESPRNEKPKNGRLVTGWKFLAFYLYFIPKQFGSRIDHKFKRTFRIVGKGPTWHIAYTHSNLINDTNFNLTRVENPEGYFLADPFVVQQGEDSICFVEQYDNLKNRGHVAAFPLTDSANVQPRPVLVEDFHLSFPFIFSFEGDYYMCPETSKIGEIRLYKAKEFPYEWAYFTTIMKDVSAADTMIFKRNGKWWMFTNLDRVGLGSHNLELHIFYSDNPLSREWTPHGMNPIYRDSLVARNGGLLNDDRNIYRVSQMQGFARYGEGIRINRIVNLSENEYLEVEIKRYVKAFARNSKGNHHMSSDKGTTVLDYFA